jgi:hypothetical protein
MTAPPVIRSFLAAHLFKGKGPGTSLSLQQELIHPQWLSRSVLIDMKIAFKRGRYHGNAIALVIIELVARRVLRCAKLARQVSGVGIEERPLSLVR